MAITARLAALMRQRPPPRVLWGQVARWAGAGALCASQDVHWQTTNRGGNRQSHQIMQWDTMCKRLSWKGKVARLQDTLPYADNLDRESIHCISSQPLTQEGFLGTGTGFWIRCT